MRNRYKPKPFIDPYARPDNAKAYLIGIFVTLISAIFIASLFTGCIHRKVTTELKTGSYAEGECFIYGSSEFKDPSDVITYKVEMVGDMNYLAIRTSPSLNGIRRVIINKKDTVDSTKQVQCPDKEIYE